MLFYLSYFRIKKKERKKQETKKKLPFHLWWKFEKNNLNSVELKLQFESITVHMCIYAVPPIYCCFCFSLSFSFLFDSCLYLCRIVGIPSLLLVDDPKWFVFKSNTHTNSAQTRKDQTDSVGQIASAAVGHFMQN